MLLDGFHSVLRGALEASVDTLCVADSRFAGPFDGFAHVHCAHAEDALQFALGAALAGARAVAVCRDFSTDALASIAHCGVNAALVIVLADDDDRPYFDLHALAECCHLPMMEPAAVYECKTFVKMACNFSEKYDVPVLVHLSQALLDTTDTIEVAPPKELRPKAYKRNREKYVTLPTTNRLCAEDMEVRDKRMRADCEAFPIHNVLYRDKTMGVVCYGTAYANLMAAAPHLSMLRLGFSYPLPLELIRTFAANVEDLVVFEEGEPLVERALHMAGIACRGQDVFPLRMHYTPADIKERLLGVEMPHEDSSLPIRTPAFCTNCPLIDLFTQLKKADAVVHADTRCAMLGADIPMVSVDTAIAPSPVALGNGFALHAPCVSVVQAALVTALDLRDLAPQHTVLVYGDIASLQADLSALGIPFALAAPTQVADHLTGGVVLVPLTLACL